MKKIYACELYTDNCFNCLYADECGYWLDRPEIPVPQITVEGFPSAVSDEKPKAKKVGGITIVKKTL